MLPLLYSFFEQRVKIILCPIRIVFLLQKHANTRSSWRRVVAGTHWHVNIRYTAKPLSIFVFYEFIVRSIQLKHFWELCKVFGIVLKTHHTVFLLPKTWFPITCWMINKNMHYIYRIWVRTDRVIRILKY